MDEVVRKGSTYIRIAERAFLWLLIKPHVEDALEHSMGEYTADDVRNALLTNDMQLFLACDKGLKAVIVTQITKYPQKKVLRVFLLHGIDFDSWAADMQETLERYQAFIGADHIEAVVRPGLAKKLKSYGWQPSQIMMTFRR